MYFADLYHGITSSYALSGPLNRLNAILSPLHPLDRYRTPCGRLECYAEKPRERNDGESFADMGKKCGGNSAKISPIFVLQLPGLVGNCSATRYSVAAPPPGARQGFGGPMHPRHPPAVADREVRQAAFWGGVAATPLLHTQNCGMSRDRGVATPWSATGGGVASAPLSFQDIRLQETSRIILSKFYEP